MCFVCPCFVHSVLVRACFVFGACLLCVGVCVRPVCDFVFAVALCVVCMLAV